MFQLANFEKSTIVEQSTIAYLQKLDNYLQNSRNQNPLELQNYRYDKMISNLSLPKHRQPIKTTQNTTKKLRIILSISPTLFFSFNGNALSEDKSDKDFNGGSPKSKTPRFEVLEILRFDLAFQG